MKKKISPFYVCPVCGNILTSLNENETLQINCCGNLLEPLALGKNQALASRHAPQIIIKNNVVTINVGWKQHVMTKDHYIEWIAIKTSRGFQIKSLDLNGNPSCTFVLDKETLISAYAYCNQYGLWQKEVL